MDRRTFIEMGLLGAAQEKAPAQTAHWDSPEGSPMAVQIGDVSIGEATIWGRAGRSSRMAVRWRTSDRAAWNRIAGPACTEASDYTGRVLLPGLPDGQKILLEVQFEEDGGRLSAPLTASFRSAQRTPRDLRFLWSGDMVGQGWGINTEFGGCKIFETMRRREPDFFIHSGDTIYADGPIKAEVKLPDGSLWKNVVTPEKSKIAETLDEFRGAYRYNLMDENVRRFSAAVPQIWQWDDHEVMNNWSPGKDISADRNYSVKSVPLLVARATKAFLDYAPIRFNARGTDRVFRKVSHGPLLDVFVLDMRSFRGPNTHNRQEKESPETTYLGSEQREWLKQGLLNSKALWKVIAADMPIGLQVPDGRDEQGRNKHENQANGNGPALGRELEFADLFRFIKQNRIRNHVWFTADTHYTGAHYYDPAKALFTDFLPFWEFMSGPLNAGTFGPNATDDTFGIQVMYQKHAPAGSANLPPSAGMQFFGEVNIAARSGAMTVVLRDLVGTALYTKELMPERS